MNYKNFSLLYNKKPEIKNNFYLKDYNKEKIKNKKVKYSSNILSTFYETYSQFEKQNFCFIDTNKIFKLKYTKKIDIQKLHITLSKVKNKIKYYNMHIINNLIMNIVFL